MKISVEPSFGASMRANRKPFRIEALVGGAPIADRAASNDFGPNHAEIMAELKSIRSMIAPAEEVSRQVVEAYKSELQEAMKLKHELDSMYAAISETKHEIATLHVTGFKGREMVRVTHELDAIVLGTQDATEGILSAAEAIDQIASQLAAKIKNTQDRGAIEDIQSKIITVFEHCNFQDLTGQRITKVVNTLKFVEDRINRMMDIWGGIESFKDVEVDVIAEKAGDAALLNGPKLEDDAGHASQDDIDALFA